MRISHYAPLLILIAWEHGVDSAIHVECLIPSRTEIQFKNYIRDV